MYGSAPSVWIHGSRHGGIESAQSLRICSGFSRNGYCSANSALVVAGDITASELRLLAEKYFGAWHASGSDAVRARG